MDNGIFAMLVMACVFCNANEYHHLNMGPEICVTRDYEHNYSNSYNKISVVGGINLRYEYLEPNNFYFGALGKYMIGSMEIASTRVFPKKYYYDLLKLSVTHKSLEAAVGYNFLAFRDFLVTPYLGIGDGYTRVVSENSKVKLRMSSEALYLTHGFRSEYIMSDTVRFGVVLKQYCTLRGVSRSNSPQQYINPLWSGFEVSFPWSVQFAGGGESLVVKIDPYFRKDNVNSMEWSAGLTLQISCDF